MAWQWKKPAGRGRKEEPVMKIIAGLGNPGKKYAHTRHNAGFETMDRLAEKYGIRIETEKFRALTGTGLIDGTKVLLLKPLTYMNNSGISIRAACDFYKLNPEEDLIVICDDIALPPGQLRVRAKGSAGGHNGLKNIISQLGTQEFTRVRIGVGEEPAGSDLADYVLATFPRDEQAEMEEAFTRAGEAAVLLLTRDAGTVMNQYNVRKS